MSGWCHMRRFDPLVLAAIVLNLVVLPPAAWPQGAVPKSEQSIFCGALFDSGTGSLRRNILVSIQGDRFASVSAAEQAPAGALDLSAETCLPGLIDAHTHVLLQGDVTSADYDVQLLKQSQAFRSILATQSARRALNNGFTTIRDVETEGAGYADVDIKCAIEQGVIPGPRMRVATRALDVTGAYPLFGYVPGLAVAHGVRLVDGPDEVRKAVREQISFGADWLKLYVDRGYRVEAGGVLNDIPTFTPEKLAAAVDEAHRERKLVGACDGAARRP
jgi:imidazolonepropionase-like amidohydrolase